MGTKTKGRQASAGAGSRRKLLALALGGIVLVAAVVGGLATGFIDDDEEGTSPDLVTGDLQPRPGDGAPAPEFDLAAFDGDGRVQAADFSGRPLVLNFWASWCPPCIEEMPHLETIHQRFEDDIYLLGVNLNDDPDLAARLAEATGVSYPMAADPDGRFFQDVGGQGMPLTLFITADGHVVQREQGRALSVEQLVDLIMNHLLEEA